jgi:hypothetical protein
VEYLAPADAVEIVAWSDRQVFLQHIALRIIEQAVDARHADAHQRAPAVRIEHGHQADHALHGAHHGSERQACQWP